MEKDREIIDKIYSFLKKEVVSVIVKGLNDKGYKDITSSTILEILAIKKKRKTKDTAIDKPIHGKCIQIRKSGENKGKYCGRDVAEGEKYCKRCLTNINKAEEKKKTKKEKEKINGTKDLKSKNKEKTLDKESKKEKSEDVDEKKEEKSSDEKDLDEEKDLKSKNKEKALDKESKKEKSEDDDDIKEENSLDEKNLDQNSSNTEEKNTSEEISVEVFDKKKDLYRYEKYDIVVKKLDEDEYQAIGKAKGKKILPLTEKEINICKKLGLSYEIEDK